MYGLEPDNCSTAERRRANTNDFSSATGVTCAATTSYVSAADLDL